ncbi:MAG: cytidylate kinase-like family protein [Lachnospiraceae bacterium]|nr:cytidylate kinase-like family protein [Lachnospiraceae bacterium]
MAKKFTITLGRECGAGATLIAETLSNDLHIPYYDKDIFRMVSDRSGVLEEFFHVNNERPGNNLLYKLIKELNPKQQKPSLGKDIVSPDNLFRFQSELIKELAENETCMIIGRCSDYILKDYDHIVKVFVCGDSESKVRRMMSTFSLERSTAIDRIKETDKQRRKYYSYYTGRTWDVASNYDLCLNTSNMTIEEGAEIIKCYLKQKGYID